MRLIKDNFNRDGSGSVTLMPEEPEDMWHSYNLIREGDLLRTTAVRKVVTTLDSGSKMNERVNMVLTIRVKKSDFDPQAGQLHVAGQVAVENKFVKLGGYHTLDLELHRNFTLEKDTGWDTIALDILHEAVDPVSKVQMWAVVIQEGLANICLITEHQTIRRQKVEMPLPKKRAGSSDHENGLQNFFKVTHATLLRQIDLEDPKPLLIAGPGFTPGSFQQYMKSEAQKSSKSKQLQNLLAKVTVAHAASGHLHSLQEVLSSQAVTKQLSDAKFARETLLMDRFSEMIRKDDLRAWYGPKECEKAVSLGAVGKGGGVLLISNALFRSQDIATRRRWVNVVDEVKQQGGEVRVLSSMHESGKRLEGLGNIAAILTYAIADLDEDEDPAGAGDGAE